MAVRMTLTAISPRLAMSSFFSIRVVYLVTGPPQVGVRPHHWRDKPPENRYEHIPVRFSQAILGLRNFPEAYPASGAPATLGVCLPNDC
ncbi:hypothetical protein MARHY2694 [Marinobacter nauticus ATCC 49840]|nr:hypothetical protein MARHY2694 [Marinobacter nauticus ATCC 49840]